MAVGEQLPEGEPDELLSFAPLEDGNGLEIVDHIEQRHVRIKTPEDVTPISVSAERFDFPIDRAASIEAKKLHFPHSMGVYVRNSLGFVVAEMTDGDSQNFPIDDYSLDLTSSIKLYVEFEAACSIDVSQDSLVVEFPMRVEVHVGARSYHKRPAETIVTTRKPTDMMTAISYFGSALKTFSCERSFPTLRGHPPLVEIGDKVSIPSLLSKPDTGVAIEIPPELRFVYGIAPLAYYLGASVQRGDEPRVVTDSGFKYSLVSSSRDFETIVERVLKQVFFFDCVTRTEGLYQVDLFERESIEGSVDLEYEELYEQSIQEQLPAYLNVPFEAVEPHLPMWKLSAYVGNRPTHIESIPFLVNDLAVIKQTRPETKRSTSSPSQGIDKFLRGAESDLGSLDKSVPESSPSPQTVRIDEADTLEQTWLGEGAPLGASKSVKEAYVNRIGLTPTDGNIDITVVCNDESMTSEEDVANNIYGSRKELPFNVDIRRNLGVDGLHETLREEIDFLHYIGHIDAEGFECNNGRFDASELDRTGVAAFFLNACTSYSQGMNLIKAGSVSGVVTLRDVINSGAERIGETLASLLNQGFPIRAALDIAKNKSIMGGHYLVLGDGSVDIAQSDRLFPISYDVRESLNGFVVDRIVHPHREAGMGSLIYPHLEGDGECYIASGKCGSFTVSDEEGLKDVFESPELPLRVDGKLIWSNELTGQ